MGVSYSNPQFDATNYALDYSCNLIVPGRPQIMQRLGPSAAMFPDQAKNQLLTDMSEAIYNSNPKAVEEYTKYRYMTFLAIGLFIAGFLVVAIVSGVGGASYAIVLLVICWIAGIVLIFMTQQKIRALSHTWRTGVLQQLNEKLNAWKSNYPQWTFTIIFPVEVWRRSSRRRHGHRRGRQRLVAIWAYVRVTQGPCQTGNNEPIYATSSNVPQQQQIIIQQPMTQQQPIMVDQNGRQVVMVQAPQQQQLQQHVVYQQPQQQQVVYQQPPQQQQVVYQQSPHAQPQQQVVYQQPPQQQQVVYQQPPPQQVYQQPPQQEQPFNPDIDTAPDYDANGVR